jgi:hypothetical protein
VNLCTFLEEIDGSSSRDDGRRTSISSNEP